MNHDEANSETTARTPGRPTRAATAGVREAILDAAEALFAQRGFAATPVRDISERAGANPAMVNYYFGSKQALLAQVMERSLEPLADAIAHPRVHVDTSGETVQLKVEPGLDLPDVDLPVVEFPGIVMYFGGVGAVLHDTRHGFEIVADPRRAGGVCLGRSKSAGPVAADDAE